MLSTYDLLLKHAPGVLRAGAAASSTASRPTGPARQRADGKEEIVLRRHSLASCATAVSPASERVTVTNYALLTRGCSRSAPITRTFRAARLCEAARRASSLEPAADVRYRGLDLIAAYEEVSLSPRCIVRRRSPCPDPGSILRAWWLDWLIEPGRAIARDRYRRKRWTRKPLRAPKAGLSRNDETDHVLAEKALERSGRPEPA